MEIYCRGDALIRHATSGQLYQIESDELEWEVVATDEEPMGERVHYEAALEHPLLGVLSWNLWEYPAGVQEQHLTESNGHFVEQDFDYGLEHTPDDDEPNGRVEELVEWFRSNYEDPAQHTSYNSQEGGYLWNHGGPYDAREELSDNFPNAPEWLIEAAAKEIESEGLTEWAGIDGNEPYDDGIYSIEDPLPDFSDDSPEEEEEDADEVPIQVPGIAFGLTELGQIGIHAAGTAEGDDLAQIATLRAVVVDALDDLAGQLDGSNAYATIALAANRYRSALSAEPPSIDLVYALGVRLENARARLEAEVRSGDYPPMASGAGEALDTVLAVHGPILLSTARGRCLFEQSREYATWPDTDRYRLAAGQLAEAVSNAPPNMLADDAREAVVDAMTNLGTGASPERTSHVAHTTARNFLAFAAQVALFTAVNGLVLPGIGASGVGAAAVRTIGAGIDIATAALPTVVGDFLLSAGHVLRELAAASGPDLQWVPSLLNRLERLWRAHGRERRS